MVVITEINKDHKRALILSNFISIQNFCHYISSDLKTVSSFTFPSIFLSVVNRVKNIIESNWNWFFNWRTANLLKVLSKGEYTLLVSLTHALFSWWDSLSSFCENCERNIEIRFMFYGWWASVCLSLKYVCNIWPRYYFSKVI